MGGLRGLNSAENWIIKLVHFENLKLPLSTPQILNQLMTFGHNGEFRGLK